MKRTIEESKPQKYLSPADVAKQLDLSKVEVVLAWIHAGELKAINIASNPKGRPTWRIAAADLDAFLEKRQAVAVPKAERRTNRRRLQATRYF